MCEKCWWQVWISVMCLHIHSMQRFEGNWLKRKGKGWIWTGNHQQWNLKCTFPHCWSVLTRYSFPIGIDKANQGMCQHRLVSCLGSPPMQIKMWYSCVVFSPYQIKTYNKTKTGKFYQLLSVSHSNEQNWIFGIDSGNLTTQSFPLNT